MLPDETGCHILNPLCKMRFTQSEPVLAHVDDTIRRTSAATMYAHFRTPIMNEELIIRNRKANQEEDLSFVIPHS
jgi:hypothetical protein